MESEEQSFDYEARPPIGIDLGTTNSAVARWVNRPRRTGSVVYNLNQLGNENNTRLLSSAVYLESVKGEEHLIVGREARRRRIAEPDRVATAFKRRIGDTAQSILLGEKHFSAADLSTQVVGALLQECVGQGLRKPEGVVVSVPYYFKQHQKHNTRRAVESALTETFAELPEEERPELLGLIPEPVAAALSYASERFHQPVDQTVLVFDFGGGTLDLMLMRLRVHGQSVDFEVLATEGEAQFGGEDFDEALEAYFVEREGLSLTAKSERHTKLTQTRIREAIVDAKEQLSHRKRADIALLLPSGEAVDATLTRDEFEKVLYGKNASRRDFVAELETLLQQCLSKAGLPAAEVTTVLPVGGSSQIPLVRQMLKQNHPKANLVKVEGGRLLAVAQGAALYAAHLLDRREEASTQHLDFGGEISILTRTSHDLGIEKHDGSISVLVPAGAALPEGAPRREKKHYWPSSTDGEGRLSLAAVSIYQGEDEAYDYVGEVELPEAYLHGRSLEEVDIAIEFQVDATQVEVEVVIPEASPDGRDIREKKSLRLEEKDTGDL